MSRPDPATGAEIAAGLREIGVGGTPAYIRGYNRGYDDAFEEVRPLEARLTEAISTLENYGDHHEWCPAYRDTKPCACQFDELLKRLADSSLSAVPGTETDLDERETIIPQGLAANRIDSSTPIVRARPSGGRRFDSRRA